MVRLKTYYNDISKYKMLTLFHKILQILKRLFLKKHEYITCKDGYCFLEKKDE